MPLDRNIAAPLATQMAAGDVRSAVSDGLVALLKEYYGRGPDRAKTYVTNDLVACLLRGGFTRSERQRLSLAVCAYEQDGGVVAQRTGGELQDGVLQRPHGPSDCGVGTRPQGAADVLGAELVACAIAPFSDSVRV